MLQNGSVALQSCLLSLHSFPGWGNNILKTINQKKLNEVLNSDIMAVPRELDCFKARVLFYIWYIPLLHHPIEIRPISQPSSSFQVHWQDHLVTPKNEKKKKK